MPTAPTPSTGSSAPAEPAAGQRPGIAPPPEWLLAGLVVLLGLALRLHDYTLAPGFTDNADEVQFTWAGLNLLLHGDAYTWSYFPGYASYTRFDAFGTNYPLVHHWLDHPPLFSYLMGGWALLAGSRDMASTGPEVVRLPPILLSTAAVLLTYLLGRRLLGRWAALVGAALLAVTPAAVLLGREAEPEALLAVLFLLALWAGVLSSEGKAGRWVLPLLLGCCLLAPLAKVSGIAVAGSLAISLLTCGRWRVALAAAAAGAAGLLLWLLYGALIDWQLFLHITQLQAQNRRGVLTGFDLIQSVAGVNRRLRDGWWLLGWMGLAALSVGRGRAALFLAWPAIAYAGAIALLAGEQNTQQYGWYKWMVYPEVYLAAGWLAWQAFRRRSLPLTLLLLLTGWATATNWWLGGGEEWTPAPLLLALLLALPVLAAALAAWRPRPPYPKAARILIGAALSMALLGSAIQSFGVAALYTRL
ncbi:MAG: glycosyltransferase family 39 protein [Candidatus Dormibacter sp.]|uniref:glycosyltransferase family 39 protein n=1 Tax=Candidatus Dormibacter sp. TaxID=2973982 RepID=UPI000DB06BAB|nr:MAG: hypothetical protein DLM66_12450 [Candidatus Dormibacteraeota bacterium]